HNFVGTENLLAALARYPVGIVPQVFADLGLTYEAVHAELTAILGVGKGFVAVEIPFTPRAKRVLELTLDEARKLKHNYIGPEHILLGLLREEDGIHQRILEKLGVDPESIRTLVLQRLKSG
ncbi:MAG: ATP-dependent Clp protease ATP-binding subunit ClpC, partial [Cyanobacteria bacterium HKST-UBA02]|nr:ATP-dependent Clp protease ATP-binding subunit ClpC [Cyanobacteria bacterium HKST-UBA02]